MIHLIRLAWLRWKLNRLLTMAVRENSDALRREAYEVLVRLVAIRLRGRM